MQIGECQIRCEDNISITCDSHQSFGYYNDALECFVHWHHFEPDTPVREPCVHTFWIVRSLRALVARFRCRKFMRRQKAARRIQAAWLWYRDNPEYAIGRRFALRMMDEANSGLTTK